MVLMDDRAGIHNSSDHAHSAETLVCNVQHNNVIYVCSICICKSPPGAPSGPVGEQRHVICRSSCDNWDLHWQNKPMHIY